MTAIWFVFAAAGAAVARHQVNRLGTGWRGTMALNVVGAFGLGFLAGAGPAQATSTIVGTGLFGSLTTFSTFALEFSEAPRRIRLVIVTGTVVLGLGAATIGWSVA